MTLQILRPLTGVVCVLVLGAMVSGAPGKPAAADMELGKKVYNSTCAECHGPSGRGDGAKARRMGFHPRDFYYGAFKCRCTESGQLPTDDDLFRNISRGLTGTPMPAHEKILSEPERRAVAQYIKTLSPRFATEAQPQCVMVPEPASAGAQMVVEGEQIYRILNCWRCHGKTGRGDGPSAAQLKDDWNNPVKPYNFTVGKRFKCGSDDRDLYRTLHTGMNGSPMPSFDSAMLFPREISANLAGLQGMFSAAELQRISDYMRGQPDAASLAAMNEASKRDLVQKRTWALVYYLKSLVAAPGS